MREWKTLKMATPSKGCGDILMSLVGWLVMEDDRKALETFWKGLLANI